jgi:hypothetical protein
MDYIYSRAELTIIAAAGEDSHYGLPGVSSRRRKLQKCLRIGDFELVQIFSQYADQEEVRFSTWASRGWTLQEGFLSRGRLIFTDDEVSFLCNKMCCAESILQELISSGSEDGHGLTSEGYRWICRSQSKLPRDLRRTVCDVLSNLSSRNLSFDEDAINVCIGMLRNLGVPHWWGAVTERCEHQKVVMYGLAWHRSAPRRQRKGFPSWSWASVMGPIYFQRLESVNDCLCDIELPLLSTRWQSIAEWVDSGNDINTLSGRPYLRITGRIIIPQFTDGSGIDKFLREIPIE